MEDADDEPINAYTPPQIGPAFQAFVPPFTGPPPSRNNASSSAGGGGGGGGSGRGRGRNRTEDAAADEEEDEDNIGGFVRWNPNLKGFNDSEKKREALDKYLAAVETLFAGKEGAAAATAASAEGGAAAAAAHSSRFLSLTLPLPQVGHESALFFLHQCSYDIPAALRLLKPWAPPVEEDSWDEQGDELYPADDYCMVCRDGGNLLMCDECDSNKAFHPACVQLESVPSGHWACPYHSCTVCAQPVPRDSNSLRCAMCPTSYCASHVPPDLKIRAAALGSLEPLCHACLGVEEEFAQLHTDKGNSAPGYACRRAFLHRLQMVLKRDSRQLVRMPIVGQREFDLYLLYAEVCKRGGIAAVMAAGASAWREIRRALRLPPSVYHQAALLRRFYLQLLYPYEKQFYPYFRPLTLKAAHAAAAQDEKENDEEEENEELAAQAAQAAAAAVQAVNGGPTSHKRKRGPLSAAAAAAAAAAREEFFLPPADPSLKDDTQPDDVLLSLRVGSLTGVTSMGSSKTKEQRAKKRKAKQLEEQAKKKQKQKHKRGTAAAQKEKEKTSSRAAANQRNQRGKRDLKRGRSPTPAAAATPASSSQRLLSTKGHLCTNIYGATPWAVRANSVAVTQKHQQQQQAAEMAAEAAAAAAANLAAEAMAAAQGSVAAAMESLVDAQQSSALSLSAAPGGSVIPAGAATLAPALLDEEALRSKRKYQVMLLAGSMAASAAAAAAATAAVAAAAAVPVPAVPSSAADAAAAPLLPPSLAAAAAPEAAPAAATEGDVDADADDGDESMAAEDDEDDDSEDDLGEDEAIGVIPTAAPIAAASIVSAAAPSEESDGDERSAKRIKLAEPDALDNGNDAAAS